MNKLALSVIVFLGSVPSAFADPATGGGATAATLPDVAAILAPLGTTVTAAGAALAAIWIAFAGLKIVKRVTGKV